MEDLRQIGHVAMLLSPFTLISFLWIFTLRRKVNAQTSVLKEELARLERAEREVARLNMELRRTQALSHDRVYKRAWDIDRVLDFLGEERGRHFDPRVVDLFLRNSAAIVGISLSLPDEERCTLSSLYDNIEITENIACSVKNAAS